MPRDLRDGPRHVSAASSRLADTPATPINPYGGGDARRDAVFVDEAPATLSQRGFEWRVSLVRPPRAV